MIFRSSRLASAAMLSLLLSACATVTPPPVVPATAPDAGPALSLVNSLSWTNPLSGKADGARSSWPMESHDGDHEQFPLAQLKQCGSDGSCAWGIMRAERGISHVRSGPDGVQLDLTLEMHVDRRQEMHQGTFNMAMAIPSDVAALRVDRTERRALSLPYGKVEQVELDYGVRFSVCVQRYDAAGKALEVCAIPYI